MKPGSAYEVQHRPDDDPACRIVITTVRSESVTAITPADATAEGYADKYARDSPGQRVRAMFAVDWMDRHDNAWPLLEEQPCPTCDGFSEVDGQDCRDCDEVGIAMLPATLSDDDVLKVFEARHSTRMVWVVSFELVQALYLHKQSQRGYTANPHEGVVDAGVVLGAPSKHWQENAERHRQDALRDHDGARLAGLSTPQERLAETLRLAQERGLDTRDDLRAHERTTEKSAERTATRIERKLTDHTENDKAA